MWESKQKEKKLPCCSRMAAGDRNRDTATVLQLC
jgi:hypothetical protein